MVSGGMRFIRSEVLRFTSSGLHIMLLVNIRLSVRIAKDLRILNLWWKVIWNLEMSFIDESHLELVKYFR